jgi:hypothetical protein
MSTSPTLLKLIMYNPKSKSFLYAYNAFMFTMYKYFWITSGS